MEDKLKRNWFDNTANFLFAIFTRMLLGVLGVRTKII